MPGSFTGLYGDIPLWAAEQGGQKRDKLPVGLAVFRRRGNPYLEPTVPDPPKGRPGSSGLNFDIQKQDVPGGANTNSHPL